MLARIAGVIVLVWFYRTAAKVGEKPIQWAVIGVIGYYLAAYLTHFGVVEPLLKVFRGQDTLSGLIRQLPAFVGLAGAYIIRKKYLLKNAASLTPPPAE